MPGIVEKRLNEMGVEIPEPPIALSHYEPFILIDNLIFISGQISVHREKIFYQGKIGQRFKVEDGYKAAKMCAINLIGQVKKACCGDLDRVIRVVKIGGFVNCTSDFTDHTNVINGASDLIIKTFGNSGKHARTAVGVPSLPFGVAVEIDGVFKIS